MDKTRLKFTTKWCLVMLIVTNILGVHLFQETQANDEDDRLRRSSPTDGRGFFFDEPTSQTIERDQSTPVNWMNSFYGQSSATEGGSMFGSSGSTSSNGDTTSMTLYKTPNNLLVSVLKQLFTDIDWQTIEEARVQIVKFIHRVEQIVGTFRGAFTKGSSTTQAPSSTDKPESREDDSDNSQLSGRWWRGKGDKTTTTASKMDATRVKEMLERVACFVGYARLMNLSNEALAELDASKVVTNLFGSAGSKRNSSGWKWFG